MISIVLTSLILMATITILHYKKENQRYHSNRIERKEKRLLKHIELIIEENKNIDSKDAKIELIKRKLLELSSVHNLSIHLYKTDGSFYAFTDPKIDSDTSKLDEKVFLQLEKKIIYIRKLDSNRFWKQTDLRSYSYVNFNNENLLILYLPYTQENTLFKTELEDLLLSYANMYIFLLLGAVLFAYFVSKYITKSLKMISTKLNKTEVGSNKPFIWNSDDEIGKLVDSYNEMVIKLEESTKLLLKSEREHAWREMAKQVAHEIKNPLTPMRLEVQLLERNANKMHDEIDKKKILDFSKGMILQIDTLTRIANEFSNFAKMPVQQLKKVNFSEFAKRFSKLHSHSSTIFNISNLNMPVFIDEKQFSRVLNNLLKNAEQSIPNDRVASIAMEVILINNDVKISISDNGIGIKEGEGTKIFEPKFTTKTGGMGLGLSITKNIIESLGGKISFESEQNIGTTFYIYIPITSTS